MTTPISQSTYATAPVSAASAALEDAELDRRILERRARVLEELAQEETRYPRSASYS